MFQHFAYIEINEHLNSIQMIKMFCLGSRKKIKLCKNPLAVVQCQAFQFLRDSGNNVANSKRMKSVDILNLV